MTEEITWIVLIQNALLRPLAWWSERALECFDWSVKACLNHSCVSSLDIPMKSRILLLLLPLEMRDRRGQRNLQPRNLAAHHLPRVFAKCLKKANEQSR